MKRLLLIPALLLILISAGCIGPTMPLQPTKPTLETTSHPNDLQGRCLDRENLGLLMKYIVDLERGYK